MRRIGLIGLVTAIAGLLPLPAFAAKIDIPTVYVGNAGNAPDSTGYGAVAYDYRIGITEVTNAQYVAFLNAKAASDPVRLYSTLMPVDGGITRSGADGNYTYATIEGRENMPAVDVDWFDMVRFANWLHNGQGNGDTETGAYTLGRLRPDGLPLDLASVTRNPGALWYLPNEDEWYKAAYHKNDGVTGNYFDYPTSSDSAPAHEPPPGGANSANYNLTVGAFVTEVGEPVRNA